MKPRSLATVGVCLVALGSIVAAKLPVNAVILEPSKTWVGLARVHLEVPTLELDGDELVGEYRIRVPIAPQKDDQGEIRLRAAQPIEQLLITGGRLIGTGLSTEDGRIHQIECSVRDDGRVRIKITTPNRVLDFDTRLRVSAPSAGDA